MKYALAISHQAASIRADPQISFAVFCQIADVVERDFFSIGFVKDFETYPIEPDQSFLCSKPNISVASLEDRLHGILRQALACLPHVQCVLCNSLCRIERVSRQRREQ